MPEQHWRRHTVPEIFLWAVEKHGNRPALRTRCGDEWKTVSWTGYAHEVIAACLGLAALGLNKGDCVCILSENRPHWIYADMAIMCAGGVSAGVYPTSAPAQIEYFLNDCRARFLFVSNTAQLEKLTGIHEKLPHLEKVIVFDGDAGAPINGGDILTFDALKKLGAKEKSGSSDRFKSLTERVTPDDVAILIYTSGTTGPPKGAMLTHRNLMFEIAVHDRFLHIAEGDDLISFLPLSHIAERMLTSLRPMMHGARISFSQGPDKLVEEIREVSPHVFFAVPRIWEKFHASVSASMETAPAFRRRLYEAALATGRSAARYKYNAHKVPAHISILQKITGALIMRKIRAKIGMDRARFVICGAAPVSPDLLMWMAAIGLDVRETYGLTENGSVAAIAPLNKRKLGSVGKAVLDSDIKIAEDGEIMIRGDHVFAGYINKETETSKALQNGWLRTGDLGRLDEDDFLYITGRKRDIIITSGGKNISPSQIENELKFYPLIADCMVVGEGRRYLTCLVMLDPMNVLEYAKNYGISETLFADLARDEKILSAIEKEILRVNEKFSRAEQIKQFRLLDAPLAPGDDALTPTMKLKRDVLTARHKDLIDEMYAE